MQHSHAYFFGYGSLVNRDTHGFADPAPATLHGWRREWRHTTRRRVAYLTAVPDDTCSIEGMVAAVPDADWHALDIREGAYKRVPAAHQIEHALPHQPQVAVYAIEAEADRPPARVHPVLLSYIDVVVQGYLREFGEDGAARFFDTTSGWDTPVLNDRATPVYPRACRLSRTETAFVDAALAQRGVRMIYD